MVAVVDLVDGGHPREGADGGLSEVDHDRLVVRLGIRRSRCGPNGSR